MYRARAYVRRHSILRMVLPGMLALAALECQGDTEDLGDVVVTSEERQECPMDHGPHPLVPDTLALTLEITKVPEFHDCQRFISPSTQRYGSLYAIWVRLALDAVVFPVGTGGGIPASADSVGNPLAGETPYAIGDSTFSASGEPTDAVGVAVAIVWSDSLPYRDLGIEPGFNCLYLYNPPTWQAKMVPVADQKDCSREKNIVPQQEAGTDLAVRAFKVPALANADYPPVARWDADSNGRYFIGIKCLAAWCEIGNNIGTSPRHAGDRTRTVPGWYDEQYLAVTTTAFPHLPTTILGTMLPDPLLDRYTRGGFPTDTFVTVAWTALANGPGKPVPDPAHLGAYKTKFNFSAAAVTGSMNRIEFCRGSRSACLPRGAPTPACPATDTLWARITPGETSVPVYRCITYTDHGVTMPGVVRWRWLANDEKGWVSCPSGCCQVNQ